MHTLTRLPNWDARLVEYISETRREGIVLDWEFFNCASWVCGAIDAMTGTNIYEPFEGKSDSPISAWKMIKEHGFNSLADIVASQLPEKPLNRVARGDVVLYPTESIGEAACERRRLVSDLPDYSALGMSVAVCLADPPVAWNLSEGGLVAVPLVDCVLAFAVGEALCHQQ